MRIFLIVFFMVFLERSIFAYINSGSGNDFFQIFLSVFASIGLLFKSIFFKIKSIFIKNKKNDDTYE